MALPLWIAMPDGPNMTSEKSDARRGLQTMKARATGLLVLAFAIFILSTLSASHWSGAKYVRAMAEGALVGGLADWFAVSALFRHPLRLPIPHTALIPTRKDQLGRSLGAFVQGNFLTPEAVTERLRTARIASRIAGWTRRAGSGSVVARQVTKALAGILGVLRDEDVQGPLESAIRARLLALPAAPIAGRALAVATAEGRHRAVINAALAGTIRFMEEQRDTLRTRFGEQSPRWVPPQIDSRIFERLYSGVLLFLNDVAGNPHHELRAVLDRKVLELADRLQFEPELISRGEDLKTELLNHPAVAAWTGSLWGDIKGSLQRQAAEEGSELHQRIEAAVDSLGHTLASDPVLQSKIDRWIEGALGYLVAEYRHEAGDLIASTVARWDPLEASDRIETAVGRDLQFIRINGTVVGGLAGLVIFAIGQGLS